MFRLVWSGKFEFSCGTYSQELEHDERQKLVDSSHVAREAIYNTAEWVDVEEANACGHDRIEYLLMICFARLDAEEVEDERAQANERQERDD